MPGQHKMVTIMDGSSGARQEVVIGTATTRTAGFLQGAADAGAPSFRCDAELIAIGQQTNQA